VSEEYHESEAKRNIMNIKAPPYFEHIAIFTLNIFAFVFEAGLRNFSEHCRHKSLFAFAAVATGLCVLQSV